MSTNGGEGEGVQRNKRAWRKPREPITPQPEGAHASPPKPVKLQRRGGGVATIKETSLTTTQQPPLPAAAPGDVMESSGRPLGEKRLHQLNELTAKEPQEEARMETSSDVAMGGVASDMPVVGVATTGMELGMQEPPLISIDGSVMEGVRRVERLHIVFKNALIRGVLCLD